MTTHTGSLVIDLRGLDHDAARNVAGSVEFLPPGLTLVLVIDSPPDPGVVDVLRQYGAHLERVDIQASVLNVLHVVGWVRALRGDLQ